MVEAVAGRLAAAGEELRPGERIITGILAPPHRPSPATGAARARGTGRRGAAVRLASGGMSTASAAARRPLRCRPLVRRRAAPPGDRRRAARGGRRAHVRDARPRHRAGDRRGAARGRRGRGPRRARGARGVRGRSLERHRGGRAHARDARARRRDRGARRRAGRARVARQRQAGQAGAARGRAARRRAPALLRRLADQDPGEMLPVAQPNMHCYTRKEPVGVAGRSSPGTSRC